MSESMWSTGGDAVVDLMRHLGVDVAFGVVSVHNLPLVNAIDRDLRFVPVRHEAAAVNAADAYARVSGRVGIALTSTGTGAGNAAGSMIEALAAGSRVLHLTGQIESQYLLQGRGFIHETKDQLGMLTAVSKTAHSIASTADAATTLEQAVAEILSGPEGPVSVEWPIDLQYERHAVHQWDVRPAPAPQPDDAAIDAAVAAISAAERPLLWLGGGAVGARAEIEELLDQVRAGALASNSGRGSIDESHGAYIGNFGTNPHVRQLLGEADLLISIGTHFRSNETADYAVEMPSNHIQIDIDAAAPGRVYPTTVEIVGDSAQVLRRILDRLGSGSSDSTWLTHVAAARRAARHGLRDAIGWQAEICDGLRSALPPASVLARDVTIPSSTWGNRLFAIGDHTCNVFPHGGGIGQGLAMGLGAALARPEVPTCVLVGDGGLAVHLGELAAVAQEQPWMLILLYNDRGYGVLRNTQDVFLGRRAGVDLATPNYAELASSLGLGHRRVGAVEDLEAALTDALRERNAQIVEIDVDAMPEMPVPFTPPVTVPVDPEQRKDQS